MQWLVKMSDKPKDKIYYEVRVECLLPATLTYKILAEDPAQAIELIKNKPPNNVHHKLIGRKEFKATVYDFGTNMIRLIQNLAGR